jgi:translocation and assembly module TamA
VDLSKLPRKERIVYDTKYSSPRERHKAISRVLFTLYDKGYFKAEADSAGGDSLDLIVHIHRGNKFKNAQIRIGNLDEGMMPNAVFRDKLLYNEPFSPQRVSELFKKIIAQYENNGYPFAAVKADSVRFRTSN